MKYIYIIIIIIIFYYITNIFIQPYQQMDVTSNMLIPNNVYLTWFSLDLPYGMKKNLYINKYKNPEFNFHIYDDDMCKQFISDNFDQNVLNVFNKLKPGAYKADLFRYCILYINGGVYMDIKFKLHVKLIDLINKYGEIFVKDVDYKLRSCKRGCFNGFIITKPKNPIFLDCIKLIEQNYNNKYYGKNHLYPTGPCLLGYIIRSKYNNISYNLLVNETFKSSYTIDTMSGQIILSQYKTYRNELIKNSPTKHYVTLWEDNDIYY